MKAEDLSTRALLALSASHVVRFEHYIEQAANGGRGMRLGECEHYLAIWTGLQKRVLKAMFTKQPKVSLTEDERDEVQDAIDCGDYDDLISSAEHSTTVGTA